MDFTNNDGYKTKYVFLEGRCQPIDEPYFKGFKTKEECQKKCSDPFMEINKLRLNGATLPNYWYDLPNNLVGLINPFYNAMQAII